MTLGAFQSLGNFSKNDCLSALAMERFLNSLQLQDILDALRIPFI